LAAMIPVPAAAARNTRIVVGGIDIIRGVKGKNA